MKHCVTCYCMGVGFSKEHEEFFRGKDHVCERATEDGDCTTYAKPSVWWKHFEKHGRCCPMATHYNPYLQPEKKDKIRVGQQKQKKR